LRACGHVGPMFKPVPCGTYSDVCFQNRKSDANKLLFRTNMKSEKNRKETGTKPYQSEIKIKIQSARWCPRIFQFTVS